jgi:hypothetical protein
VLIDLWANPLGKGLKRFQLQLFEGLFLFNTIQDGLADYGMSVAEGQSLADQIIARSVALVNRPGLRQPCFPSESDRS